MGPLRKHVLTHLRKHNFHYYHRHDTVLSSHRTFKKSRLVPKTERYGEEKLGHTTRFGIPNVNKGVISVVSSETHRPRNEEGEGQDGIINSRGPRFSEIILSNGDQSHERGFGAHLFGTEVQTFYDNHQMQIFPQYLS